MITAFGVEHEISKGRKEDRRIVRRHGLTGSPAGVDRSTRKEIWAARDRHINRKKRKYENAVTISTGVENAGKVAGSAAGAALIGAQVRDAYYQSNTGSREKASAAAGRVKSARLRPIPAKLATGKPGWKTLAFAAGATATATSAGVVRRRSEKRRDKYASVSGGIASGVSNRMKRYDIGKADQTPDESLRHKKRVQAGIAYGTSTLGLAALGTKAGAGALPKAAPKLAKLPGAPKSLGSKSGAKALARKIDHASSALVATGAGLGGVGGFNFASIQRQEGKPR